MSLNLNKFVNIAFEIFVSVCMFIYSFKTPFVIAMVIFDIAMAVSIFNQIQIKIKTKFNLISLGLSIALTIISYFMTSAIAFVLTNVVIILFWRIYYAYNRKQGSYAVKNIIRTQSVIYTGSKESNSLFKSLYKVVNGDSAATDERSSSSDDGKIHTRLSIKKMQFKSGIPIFSHIYKWEMNTTATPEMFSKVVSLIMKYLPEYVVKGIRRGKWYELMIAPKQLKAVSVMFSKKISDELPWYIIPLGSVDTSSKSNALSTTYVWRLQETDEQFKCLSKMRRMPAAPMGFIVGATGGGKSVLLNCIIAHFINKHNVELYMSDPKKIEFGPYASLKEVKVVGKTKDEIKEVFKLFNSKMVQRYTFLEKLGVSILPLDGKINLDGSSVVVNDSAFKSDDIVKIKTSDGEEKEVKASELKNYASNRDDAKKASILMPGNKDIKVKDYWMNLVSDRVQDSGVYEIHPMVFICDEYAQLMSEIDGADYRINSEIKEYVQAIARLGRAAQIHLILATQTPTGDLIPGSLAGNMKFRTICGKVDANISRIAIDTEEGESIPASPKGMYLSSIDKDTCIYRGWYIDKPGVKALSEDKNCNTDMDSLEDPDIIKDAPDKKSDKKIGGFSEDEFDSFFDEQQDDDTFDNQSTPVADTNGDMNSEPEPISEPKKINIKINKKIKINLK